MKNLVQKCRQRVVSRVLIVALRASRVDLEGLCRGEGLGEGRAQSEMSGRMRNIIRVKKRNASLRPGMETRRKRTRTRTRIQRSASLSTKESSHLVTSRDRLPRNVTDTAVSETRVGPVLVPFLAFSLFLALTLSSKSHWELGSVCHDCLAKADPNLP